MSELPPNIETRDQLLKHEQELIAKARGRKTPHASSRRRPRSPPVRLW